MGHIIDLRTYQRAGGLPQGILDTLTPEQLAALPEPPGGCGRRTFVAHILGARRASGHAPSKAIAAEPRVVARIEQGRWIADCPFCGGAELVDLEEPLFYCLSCYNLAVGRAWLAVDLPPERTAIEALLGRRPEFGNRNWRPGESVKDLQRENREHGLD